MRRARVIEARRQHMTYAEIGQELGVSMQRAHEIYFEALDAIPAQQVELHRAEATELAHAAIDDLRLIARDHKQPRTSVEAWGQIRGWAEHLARIQGTNASTKVEATVTEATQQTAELQALLQEAQEIADAEDAAGQ